MTITNVLTLKQIAFLTPAMQIVLIATLFCLTTVLQLREYRRTGKLWVHYPVGTSLLFVPIYEEILFRGLIFVGLMSLYSAPAALVVSSLLFGLWHFKNIFWLNKKDLTYQMLYTGLVFGPIVAYFTLITGTIWLGVIFHYLNNLLAPYSFKELANS